MLYIFSFLFRRAQVMCGAERANPRRRFARDLLSETQKAWASHYAATAAETFFTAYIKI